MVEIPFSSAARGKNHTEIPAGFVIFPLNSGGITLYSLESRPAYPSLYKEWFYILTGKSTLKGNSKGLLDQWPLKRR